MNIIWWPSQNFLETVSLSKPDAILRNVSSSYPDREVMITLRGLDIPILAVPDDISLNSPPEVLKEAFDRAMEYYERGKKHLAQPRHHSSESFANGTLEGLTDEERRLFKDAFLGRVEFDDSVR